MKALFTLLIAVVGFQSSLFASSDNFTNFVRQYQQGTGVYWDMQNVAPTGSSTSLHSLEEGGALFQLWTIEKSTGKDYLLDQKVVGAYLPKADIRVVTRDPYDKIPRTRIDQPFSVHVTVKDLLPAGANLPQAASSVLAEHHLAPFAKGRHSVTAVEATSGKPVASGYITANGVSTFEFERSMLQQTVENQAVGEEHFVIHALSDGTFSQTQIASGFVQVWPVASGAISGIADGDRIAFHPPPITLVLRDLYPGSYTYLRVKDTQSDYEAVFEQSQYVLPDEPTDTGKLILLSDYGKMFPKDSTYRLDLVTVTPFGTDLLSTRTFIVDRTLEVRAMQAQITDN